ncbi:AAA family ATPase [Colwellia sp. UCD-KL20]|uniref:AAA family ATPase n=1 Tax=Colwellia sp. UCD-KL20 TaxID=1917165 RepID=UPI000970C20F|nr:AAA family ATPase [Colwellia sp. UCD-KL20]
METSNKLDVFFAQTGSTVKLKPRQAVIEPDEDSWNDFGYKTRCKYYVRLSESDVIVEGSILIGFLPSPELTEEEKKAFKEKYTSLTRAIKILKDDSVFIHTQNFPLFFTMLPTMQDYRDLVNKLDVDGSALFLSAVCDLVSANEESSQWYNEVLKTEVFKLGFMRNSEQFFAFNNAESVLQGAEHENFKAISQQLSLRFKLEGFSEPHDLKLNFETDSIVPRRIGVLIGKNGVGKSESLKAFCRGALQYKDKGLSLVDENGKRPLINRVIALSTPGETTHTFPPERVKTQKLFYRRLTLTRKGTRTIGENLVQLARSVDSIGENTRWDLFYNAINEVLPVGDLVVKLNSGYYLPLKYLIFGGGEQQKLEFWSQVSTNSDPFMQYGENVYPLSSGQLTFFKYALMCSLYIENGSFVLMDEPETHMHPNMISDFIGLLDSILEHTGSFALIATHSAYIVREVPAEQVLAFTKEEGRVIINNPRLPTFGATVDSISQFIFQEDAEIKLSKKIYSRIKNRDFSNIEEKLSKQLSLSALMRLKRMMEH